MTADAAARDRGDVERAPLALLPTLRGYRRGWARRDVVAGLSAGAVVVPQAMAYATIAGLPVEFGLYTCMVPMVVYALLGGSRALSMSTTWTIATLSASTLLAAGVAAGSDDPARAVCTLALLVGALLVLARVLRLGSLVENISRAVLVGIKAGVGTTVAVGQLPKLLGVPADPDATGFFEVLGSALSRVGDANLPTVLLAVGSIAVLVLLGRLAPRVPAPLVVVAAGILLVALAGIDRSGVAVIDPVPSGLPLPVLPDRHGLEERHDRDGGGRRPDEPQIDPDAELLANGLAAVAGAFFRAMPPAGGFSQTAVSLRAGARTQASGLVTAALAVLVALFLAPVLDDLPQATLGAMVVVATVSLIQVGEFVELWRINRVEFACAVVTAAIGLVAGLLPAVGVGVVMTLLLVLREADRPRAVELARSPDGGWTYADRAGSSRAPGALVLHLEGGLYTANTRPTVEAVLTRARSERPVPRVVALEMESQRLVTSTVLDGLADLDHQLASAGAALYLVRVPDAAREGASASSWFRGLVDGGRVVPSVDAALVHAEGIE